MLTLLLALLVVPSSSMDLEWTIRATLESRDATAMDCQREINRIFANSQPASADPAAKAAWKLFRVEPDKVAGPVPVILIHGLENDRWAHFIDWAANSPEAAAFRANFQVWDFKHEATGVNAAIGFSRDYPGFEESIVTYLNRFIVQATIDGVETGGVRYYFPEGPMCMLTDSSGGLKARAFMVNFPEQADRVLAVVTLSAVHLGTPLATPEWLRYTLTYLGPSKLPYVARMVRGELSQYMLSDFLCVQRQSDLDTGWGNFDAEGGTGLPALNFRAWQPGQGVRTLSLSPRDANQTDARTLPGYADTTFEPAERLSTYCGGMENIMPSARGEMGLDKFFLYGAYLLFPADWPWLSDDNKSLDDRKQNAMENAGLRVSYAILGAVVSADGTSPLGVYLLNDGISPLQSQLLLDGKETERLYETKVVNSRSVPVVPFRVREDVLREHTLVNPDRLRLLPGWSHLDTITGRYNSTTGHSALFTMVADDFLSVLPKR